VKDTDTRQASCCDTDYALSPKHAKPRERHRHKRQPPLLSRVLMFARTRYAPLSPARSVDRCSRGPSTVCGKSVASSGLAPKWHVPFPCRAPMNVLAVTPRIGLQHSPLLQHPPLPLLGLGRVLGRAALVDAGKGNRC